MRDKRQTLKIELLNQWKLEAEFHNFSKNLFAAWVRVACAVGRVRQCSRLPREADGKGVELCRHGGGWEGGRYLRSLNVKCIINNIIWLEEAIIGELEV